MRKRTNRFFVLLLVAVLTLGTAVTAQAAEGYPPTEAAIPVGGTGVFLLKEAGAPDADAVETITIDGYGEFKQSFVEPGDYAFQVFSTDAINTARYDVIVHVTTDGTWTLENVVVIAEHGTGRKVPSCPYPVSIDPPVSKKLTGEKPASAESFVFLFKGISTTAEGLGGKPPMPAGSEGLTKKITIVGEGEKEAGKIVLDRAGTYIYEFTEEKGTSAGYTYDKSVYRLTVTVTETKTGFSVEERMTKDGVTQEKTAAVFTNEYKKSSTPSIGDENRPALWAGLMASSLFALVLILWIFPRKKKNES